MALRWNWNAKVGEATFYNFYTKKNYKTSLYIGNAYLISLYRYTDENGEKMYQMHRFFCDKGHAKRCLGLEKCNDGTKDNSYNNELLAVTLYRDMFEPKHLAELVGMFASAKFDNDIKITVKATGKRKRKEVKDNA